jgi:heterodisulfide reductase subunit A-like polyferredoxin
VRSERNVNGLAPRIGVFVCHCGTNIAGTVDVHAVAEYARSLPFVAYAATNLFSCSQDTQQAMAGLIEEHSLNRIVVAACTPRTHEAIFQETLRSAGVNKYLFEMANIRNHCSWVHGGDPAAATRKSKDLVRMAVEKAMLIKPLVQHQMEVDQKALVIGGGIAGLTAAKTLAGQGFFTYLVERSDRLGGQANAVIETWKGEDIAEKRDTLIRAVRSSPNIEVHLNTELKEVEGSLGSFKTRLVSGGNTFEVSHGAAVIATGALELKPSDHLYGRHAGVMTLLELDAKLKTGDDPAGSVVFLQCVGSRIPERPYCSKVCCTHAVKSALRLKERNPETAVHILYRDMRTYGLRETLYREAREKGIHFLRFDPEKGLEVAEEAGAIRIVFHDPVLNRKLLLNPDRLVLSTAMVPPDGTPLARMFKVPLKADGFFIEAHVKLRPVDFATDGVFVCGLAHGPKPIDETTAQAQAAAARAAIVLGKPKMWVGGIVSRIDKSLCSRCCVCEAICPYRAITTDQKTHAEVNPALCKGCGLCSASCRSGAATLDGFTDAEILTQICAVQA